MAYLLEVAILDAGDSSIKVVHQFYGLTVRECESHKQSHMADCKYFHAAEKEGRTLESLDHITAGEMPTAQDYGEDEEDEEEEDEPDDEHDEEESWRV